MIGSFSLGDSAGTKLGFDLEEPPFPEGWVGTLITCQSPDFSGGLACTIHVDDLELLANHLDVCARSFPGCFRYEDIEQNIDMTVRLDRSGKGQITAMFRTDSADLCLRIDTDQSVIRVAGVDLKRLLATIKQSNPDRLT